jgi:hypothetical protein
MPRIPQSLLKSTFYLYRSAEDAREGRPFGGTGFFVGVPAPDVPNLYYVYAVTNWHAAVHAQATVIRVNKKGGGIDILELNSTDWMFRPGGQDVAVADVPIDYEKYDIDWIPTELFLSRNLVDHYDIGPGEDVFMVGRFVDHDGGDSNVPSVRFGNISVMPRPVLQPTGGMEESYLLDLHSRSGYSGSPVFVYRTSGSDLTVTKPGPTVTNRFLCLLGIHWGQFPEKWAIESGELDVADTMKLRATDRYVMGLSGMTMTVPAWAIADLLEIPDLVEKRERVFTRYTHKHRAQTAGRSNRGGAS